MIGTTWGGRYEIMQRLGGGNFGDTYPARDQQRPGTPLCVVKRLRPQNTHLMSKVLELFEQEALQLERLGNHAQIPQTGEIRWLDRATVSTSLANFLTKMVSYHFGNRYPDAIAALAAFRQIYPAAAMPPAAPPPRPPAKVKA